MYTMGRDGGPTEARLWSKGIALLERIVPETGAANDPVPYRAPVFGIHIGAISGRSCSVGRASAREGRRNSLAKTGCPPTTPMTGSSLHPDSTSW